MRENIVNGKKEKYHAANRNAILQNGNQNSKNLAFMYGSLALIIVFLVWMYVCMNIVLIGGEINFLYNNRYYYKLYLLTEKQIDIQEYFAVPLFYRRGLVP